MPQALIFPSTFEKNSPLFIVINFFHYFSHLQALGVNEYYKRNYSTRMYSHFLSYRQILTKIIEISVWSFLLHINTIVTRNEIFANGRWDVSPIKNLKRIFQKRLAFIIVKKELKLTIFLILFTKTEIFHKRENGHKSKLTPLNLYHSGENCKMKLKSEKTRILSSSCIQVSRHANNWVLSIRKNCIHLAITFI